MTMQARKIIEEKELPADFQRLFDPAQPLPSETQWIEIPRAPTGNKVFLFGAAATICSLMSVFFFGVWFFGLRHWTARMPSNRSPSYSLDIGLCLGVVAVGFFVKTFLEAARQRKLEQSNRYGLFLTSEALLLRTETTLLFFPRPNVLDFELLQPGNTKPGSSCLRLKHEDGKEEIIENIENFLLEEDRSSAREALQQWCSQPEKKRVNSA